MSHSMRHFSIVVAACVPSWGIGKNGTLPWKIPEDMKFFKTITTQCSTTRRNAVIMGRKTYLSIPDRFRPLAGRLNVVLTRNPDAFRESLGTVPDSLVICDSLEAALVLLNSPPFDQQIEQVFVAGGTEVYNIALKNVDLLDTFYLTRIFRDFECDTFLQMDPSCFVADDGGVLPEVKVNADGTLFEFVALKYREKRNIGHNSRGSVKLSEIDRRRPRFALSTDSLFDEKDEEHEEFQYLNLVRDVIANGVERPDRTGVGTLSKFGCTMRFNLRDDVFPLLTTKRVFWKGVAKELLWFVKGSTNANELAEQGIHIWDGNGSREFLDGRGLSHREVGDLGPVYGFQWRHFGASYSDMHADYTEQGVDQLKQVIETIKTRPYDRRMVMTAWNPAALHEMALPPCHMFCQFYVANGELSCQMYQRSCDLGLGVPFNIASYALLTRMIAQVCGLKAGDFVHVMGDTHVYLNHVDPLKIQLGREPKEFPRLTINPDKQNIDDFVYEDFTIEGYKPHKRIKMQMAV